MSSGLRLGWDKPVMLPIETAARIAGHESTRTTQLFDRSFQEISLDEIERIHI
jgi:hypothetical protein